MAKNKWLLLLSSLGVLALLVAAAVRENLLLEWQQIQAAAHGDEGPIAVQLRQVVNPTLRTADRCVSCHVAMGPGEQSVQGPGMAAHPPVVHDPAEFGCTVCHGGQGRATEKSAAHGRVEFWPEPMLPRSMSEAGCGTCHATVGVAHRSALAAAEATVARLDCLACHRVDARGGTLRPDEGGMEGPDLSRAGMSGWNAAWYEAHLATSNAAVSGPWKTSFGPVGEEDRARVDAYLATRVAAPRLIAAKSVFLSSGCLGCHKVNGVGGDEGPDLTRAGEKDPGRLNFAPVANERTLANWFSAHVRAPSSLVEGSQMPAMRLPDEDVEALTFYTLSLRRRVIPGPYLPRDRMRVERFGAREFASDGTTLFGAFCAGCHGTAGDGRRAPGMKPFPAVAHPGFLSVASDQLVEQTILRGRPGTRMRAWGDGSTGLTSADVKALVQELRRMSGTKAPAETRPARWAAGDAALGGRLFAATCSGCHGAKGEGLEAPALANPVLLEFATDTFLAETIKRGRPGTAMHGFAQPSTVHRALADADVEAIVSFIRTFGGRS
jgi:cbb3-type cytochrome c oxidase subunit III